MSKHQSGFSLIELLVTIAIIGILIALSIIGLRNSRQSGRDTRRKADLELIRSALELYRADCRLYYSISGTLPETIVGDDSITTCLSTNTYLSEVPTDPIPERSYLYYSDGTTYEICASLERVSGTTVSCGGSTNCGAVCNYKVTNP